MKLLIGADAQSRQAAETIAAIDEWHALVDLCARWKLLPALEARLAALGLAIPAEERAELSRQTVPAFVQSTLCVRAGATALAALQDARIPCAGFKGLATLAYLYSGPRSRTLQDVDVLTRPQDVEAALTVLEAAGFTRLPDVPWDEYVAFLRNSPGSAGNEAVSLRDAQGGAVDLHWRLGGLNIESLLAETRTMQVLGRTMPLIAPGHGMLLSVHHALRNDFVPADVARDVCDFAQWQLLIGREPRFDRLAADAQQWGLSTALLALEEIVAELQEIPPLRPSPTATHSDRKKGRQIAALYFYQLREASMNTDLTYLVSPGSALQVISGLAADWKGYRATMRRSEAMNGEPSLPLHTRIWNLAKSAVGLSPQRWRQVRTLARSKDGMSCAKSGTQMKEARTQLETSGNRLSIDSALKMGTDTPKQEMGASQG
jgi:hypothetical protein